MQQYNPNIEIINTSYSRRDNNKLLVTVSFTINTPPDFISQQQVNCPQSVAYTPIPDVNFDNKFYENINSTLIDRYLAELNEIKNRTDIYAFILKIEEIILFMKQINCVDINKKYETIIIDNIVYAMDIFINAKKANLFPINILRDLCKKIALSWDCLFSMNHFNNIKNAFRPVFQEFASNCKN